MTQMTTGYVIFATALGVMLIALGTELQQLQSFDQMWSSPLFIGKAAVQVGTVIGAYFGGRMQPTDPRAGGQRASDPPAN